MERQELRNFIMENVEIGEDIQESAPRYIKTLANKIQRTGLDMQYDKASGLVTNKIYRMRMGDAASYNKAMADKVISGKKGLKKVFGKKAAESRYFKKAAENMKYFGQRAKNR